MTLAGINREESKDNVVKYSHVQLAMGLWLARRAKAHWWLGLLSQISELWQVSVTGWHWETKQTLTYKDNNSPTGQTFIPDAKSGWMAVAIDGHACFSSLGDAACWWRYCREQVLASSYVCDVSCLPYNNHSLESMAICNIHQYSWLYQKPCFLLSNNSLLREKKILQYSVSMTSITTA